VIYRFPYGWVEPVDLDSIGQCSLVSPPEDAGDSVLSVEEALEGPIGALTLEEGLRKSGARNVLILVDDMTRDTPQKTVLPQVLRRVERARIRPDRISILVAVGLHRPMTREEMLERFGTEVCSRHAVVNHDAFLTEALRKVGDSEDDVPILVNSLALTADYVIAVGQIGPHRIAGFSGGAKMIEPGICGQAITSSVHWKGWLADGTELYGKVENPIRAEMERIADSVGLDFIVNCVRHPRRDRFHFVAGDRRAAFRAGAETSASWHRTSVTEADIVVVDSAPYDIDLWQACKAVSVAEMVVKRGGTIILVTPIPEGLGPYGERIRRTGYLPRREIVARVESGEIPDRFIACHLMAFGRIIEHGQIIVVSSATHDALLDQVGLPHAPNVTAAIQRARSRMGRGATVAVLRDACKLIPVTSREGALAQL